MCIYICTVYIHIYIYMYFLNPHCHLQFWHFQYTLNLNLSGRMGRMFLGASSEAYPYGKDWVNNLLDELPETKDVET